MSFGYNNQISFRNTLESTQPSTGPGSGALILKGGLAINLDANSTSSTSGGALTIAGGAAFGGSVFIGGDATVANLALTESLVTENGLLLGDTPSTSPTTGTLLMSGGIGIANDTDSLSYTNGGTLSTAGGAAIAKTLRVGTAVISESLQTDTCTITGNSSSTSPSTGALVITGGLAISNTSDAISSSDGGACTILGGLAVGKKLFVGGSLNTIEINGNNTLAITTADTGSESLVFDCSGTITINSEDTNLQSTNSIALYATDNTNIPNQISVTSNSSSNDSIKFQADNGGISITAQNGQVYITADSVAIDTTTSTTITSTNLMTIDSQTSITIGNSSPEVTIGQPLGTLTIPSTVEITNTTPSSDTGSGALTISGGLGVAGNVYASSVFDNNNRVFSIAGTNLDSSGTTVSTVNNPEFSTMVVNSTLEAESITNGGAMTVSGGAAVARNLFVGDSITVPTVNLTQSLSVSTLEVQDDTPSTSSTTGAIVSNGGVGISNTEDSTEIDNGGALTIAGGAAIAKTLRVKDLITDTISSTGDFNLSNKISSIPRIIFTEKATIKEWKSVAISNSGQYQIAATSLSSDGYIYTSSNSGESWIQVSSAPLDTPKDWAAVAISSDGTKQMAVVNGGYMYRSNDSGVNWFQITSVPIQNPFSWKDICMSEDGQYITAFNQNLAIFRSIDNGATWDIPSNPYFGTFPGTPVACSMSESGLFQTVVRENGYIFRSIDSGSIWDYVASQEPWTDISMSADGVYQTAVGTGIQIYRSIDFGANWTAVGPNLQWSSVSVSGSGETQYAVVSNGLIYKSIDYGETWNRVSLDIKDWSSISISDTANYITASATNDYLYTSSTGTTIYIDNNVGIGTSECIHDLCVYSENAKMSISGVSENDKASIFFGTPSNGSASGPMKTAIISEGLGPGQFSKSKFHICLDNTNDDYTDASISSSRMTILPNGNIGIGTTSPAYKLQVVGGVKCNSILFSGVNQNVLSSYHEFMWTTDITTNQDAAPVIQSITAYITKIGRLVTIKFPQINFSSGVVGNGVIGIGSTGVYYFYTGALDEDFRPANDYAETLIRSYGNPAIQVGVCRYTPNRFQIYQNISESPFSNNGGYEILPFQIEYSV